MTRAYSELYIDEFRENFGEAFEFATLCCGMPLKEFYDRFLASGVAGQIERGNPTYLVGLSGMEVVYRIVEKTGGSLPDHHFYDIGYPGPEYWTGWILAYLQWRTGWTFSFLARYGFDAESVMAKFHPYHEAHEDKFVEDAVEAIGRRMAAEPSSLKTLRKAAGLTQKELSERSGVKLRMIQAYEQRYQDISRAEAASVEAMAKVLGCTGSALMKVAGKISN